MQQNDGGIIWIVHSHVQVFWQRWSRDQSVELCNLRWAIETHLYDRPWTCFNAVGTKFYALHPCFHFSLCHKLSTRTFAECLSDLCQQSRSSNLKLTLQCGDSQLQKCLGHPGVGNGVYTGWLVASLKIVDDHDKPLQQLQSCQCRWDTRTQSHPWLAHNQVPEAQGQFRRGRSLKTKRRAWQSQMALEVHGVEKKGIDGLKSSWID